MTDRVAQLGEKTKVPSTLSAQKLREVHGGGLIAVHELTDGDVEGAWARVGPLTPRERERGSGSCCKGWQIEEEDR